MTRAIEGATETLQSSLPVAIGAQKGLAEARYPAIKQIMMAKKKKVDSRDLDTGATSKLATKSLTLPSPRPEGRILGNGVEAVPELVRVLREEAKVL